MEYFNGKFTDFPIEYFLKFIVIPLRMGKAVGNNIYCHIFCQTFLLSEDIVLSILRYLRPV